MSWSLSASGHTPAPEGESGWEAVEKELHGKLTEILSDPKYGCSRSSFGGNHVHGPVHITPEDAPDDGQTQAL